MQPVYCFLRIIGTCFTFLSTFLRCSPKTISLVRSKKSYFFLPAHSAFAVLQSYEQLLHLPAAVRTDFVTCSHDFHILKPKFPKYTISLKFIHISICHLLQIIYQHILNFSKCLFSYHPSLNNRLIHINTISHICS